MTVTSSAASILDLARTVLRTEAAAILRLVDTLGVDFERAIDLLFDCRGRVIVTGMGKSGIICRKSPRHVEHGTPAFFLHPAEPSTETSGALRDEDVVIAVSRPARPRRSSGCSSRFAASAPD